jgi:hypothetical protein
MLKVERSTAPDPWPANASTNVVPIKTGLASTKQQNYINTLLTKKGLSGESADAFINNVIGTDRSINELTSHEASTLIKALTA